tara:strand:+ start:1428 stop:1994 length:567 start_codon:yes stop_codon:yes gene_type:complete
MNIPKINCAHDELRDVATLTAHPRNPNTHDDDQIRLLSKIIKHQGWRNPIVVSKLSGFIVAGHGRLLAAEKLGLEQVPVDLQDFDNEADELAHLVADNRIAELAEIDRSSLADIIGDLDTGDFDLEFTGFKLSDVEELITTTELDETDLSNDIIALFKIEIDFNSESELENAYEKLIKKGYQCRILTL